MVGIGERSMAPGNTSYWSPVVVWKNLEPNRMTLSLFLLFSLSDYKILHWLSPTFPPSVTSSHTVIPHDTHTPTHGSNNMGICPAGQLLEQ